MTRVQKSRTLYGLFGHSAAVNSLIFRQLGQVINIRYQSTKKKSFSTASMVYCTLCHDPEDGCQSTFEDWSRDSCLDFDALVLFSDTLALSRWIELWHNKQVLDLSEASVLNTLNGLAPRCLGPDGLRWSYFSCFWGGCGLAIMLLIPDFCSY